MIMDYLYRVKGDLARNQWKMGKIVSVHVQPALRIVVGVGKLACQVIIYYVAISHLCLLLRPARSPLTRP